MRALLLFTIAFTAAAAPDFLDSVMSLPFASDLSASPDGKHLAWVVYERGLRNIWLADYPDWKPRQATVFNTDEGLDIEQIAWARSSQFLVFTRAGEFGPRVRQPNPTNAIEPPVSKLWKLTLTAGATPLAEGQYASVSPDEHRIWFIRNGQPFSVAPDGSGEKQAFHCEGTVTDLTWSPDGKRLALRVNRVTHAFIGTYAPGTNSLTYLDPSTDSDSSPIWSSDSKEVAFVREPANTQELIERPHRSGPPWSIRIVAADGSSSREVFHAGLGPGSMHYGWSADKQIFWIGNTIYFGWEKTGWLHLYSVAASGGKPEDKTPGNGEISDIALSFNGKRLTYSGNFDDIDRLRAYELNQHAIFPESDASQSTPVAIEGGIAFIATTYKSPAHVVIAAHRLPEPICDACIQPESVQFKSADGLSVHGQLFRPAGAGKHPAIVFVHGGSRRQMYLGFHPMHYYSNAYAFNQYLAQLGYIVLSVNYRSGTGYGLDFREQPGFGPNGGSEYQDVKAAAAYLQSQSDVDKEKIGIWGGSWGGYLTAMALAHDSDTFKAGVDFHGVHDWRLEMDSSDDTPEHVPQFRRAFVSSPLASIQSWRSPVLLIHGDDDRNVVFIETVRLVEALRAQNVPFEELIFPGETHHLLLWEHWIESYRRAATFLQKSLR